MISRSRAWRFAFTAIGLGVGATAGYFVGPAFASGDGFEELGAAIWGAILVSPLGAVTGDLIGARIARRRGAAMDAPGAGAAVGRAILEGFGLLLGFVGGWALASVLLGGENVFGFVFLLAAGGGFLGFLGGASLADRISAQANQERKRNGES